MPSATTSNLEALTKILYPNGIIYQGVKQSRFYNLCRKSTDFGGKSKEVKVSLSPGTGGSSDFAKALANRGPAQHVTFTVTRKHDYVIGSLENEVIKATMGDKNAVLSALTDELDKKGKEMGTRLSRRCWGNAGGSLGRATTISTNTIVLDDRTNARNFHPGMVVMFASDDGTGTSPTGNRVGTLTVSKVAYVSGSATITFTENVTTGIPAATANDYVFSDGDYAQAPNGVLGWIPTTDPTGSFLGVDRTVNIHATSGFRIDKSGVDMIEAINSAAAEGFPFGAEGEYMFVGGTDMAKLQNTLEGKAITRDVTSPNGKASYKGLVVYTTYGEITVLPEPWAPTGKLLITSMADWEICSLGELPHFTDTGHGKMQQESAADAQQFRLAAYWNIINKNPAGSVLLSV